FRPLYGNLVVSVRPQKIRETTCCLDPSGDVVQAEHDLLELAIRLRQPEHDLFRRAAEGYIAVLPPSLRIKGEEGQQVNGRLEHIEPAAVSAPVETAPGITSLHISPEALSPGVQSPLVGMTGNAVFVASHEHGVVI